jgi:hypothetical protein
MAEDFAATRVSPGYNSAISSRLPYFLNTASYNCSITSFRSAAGTCFSYAVNGSFGAYLNRQLGVGFYRTLLARPESDSFNALDQAIRAHRPGSTLPQELRKWNQSTVATVQASQMPPGFGYPERLEDGYALTEIDLLPLRSRQAFSSAPAQLEAYASFPWLRSSASDLFEESVTVPPGATLSVIVRQ